MSAPYAPQWEQPTFTPPGPERPVSGVVLVPGEAPQPTGAAAEERRLGQVLRLVWPVALVLALATGEWLPLLVLALVVRGLVKRRVRELQAYRYREQELLR